MSSERQGPGPVVLRNPAAGEVVHLHPARDGAVHAEVHLDPVHTPPPGHVHPRSVEAFHVTVGTVEVRVGRRWHALHAGDRVTVAPGTTHAYRNTSGAPASFTVVVEPPGRLPEFWRAIYRAAEDGRVTGAGQVRLPVRSTTHSSRPWPATAEHAPVPAQPDRSSAWRPTARRRTAAGRSRHPWNGSRGVEQVTPAPRIHQ